MKTDFIQIASYASKAPSGHNTQPWKFHITDSTITVLPNLDVALPVVDRNNRELIYIMAIKYQMEFYNNFNPFQKKMVFNSTLLK